MYSCHAGAPFEKTKLNSFDTSPEPCAVGINEVSSEVDAHYIWNAEPRLWVVLSLSAVKHTLQSSSGTSDVLFQRGDIEVIPIYAACSVSSESVRDGWTQLFHLLIKFKVLDCDWAVSWATSSSTPCLNRNCLLKGYSVDNLFSYQAIGCRDVAPLAFYREAPRDILSQHV